VKWTAPSDHIHDNMKQFNHSSLGTDHQLSKPENVLVI